MPDAIKIIVASLLLIIAVVVIWNICKNGGTGDY